MRRVGSLSLEGAVILVGAVVVLLGVTRCNARREGARAERVAQLESNAYKSSLAGIAARRSTDSLMAKSVADSVRLARQVAANRTLSARLSATLAANDSLLTADSVDVPTLREALRRTSEVARLYRDSTDALLGSVERALASQSEERKAWLAERQAHALELAAKDSLIAALRESGQACRILFVACPSRVQSVGIGAGIVLLLLL